MKLYIIESISICALYHLPRGISRVLAVGLRWSLSVCVYVIGGPSLRSPHLIHVCRDVCATWFSQGDGRTKFPPQLCRSTSSLLKLSHHQSSVIEIIISVYYAHRELISHTSSIFDIGWVYIDMVHILISIDVSVYQIDYLCLFCI